MKTTARFIVFHPSVHKSGGGGFHRAWLGIFVLFFIFTFAFTLLNTRDATVSGEKSAAAARVKSTPIPDPVFDALLHYASENTTSSGRMSADEVRYIAGVVRRCAAPCNLLVFGLTRETLLWRSLNYNGRTVFVDESAYLISKLEEKHPSIEAYDVQFTTKVSELRDLIEYYKAEAAGECRPVQNLLFSDCRLAINDLPNHIYDVAWDIILIDGPRGYFAGAPGRMAPIFTSGVLARTKRGGAAATHVLVHEIDRELERICSGEFLCGENLAETKGSLGHFVIPKSEAKFNNRFQFCSNFGSSISPKLI
ncbi:protein IRX15-LIKE-like [Andrographis paniculata]|uniref:protein IRX15-LIKE-like n=1 Tax=Andrographis paniculata TaxID=175694 RepID=UPI0021E8ECF6|nr:protein IRX15-LIKE-like [Andrographis paniculata]